MKTTYKLKDINWQKILTINFFVLFCVFSPFLPITGYVHGLSMGMFLILSVIFMGLLYIFLLGIFGLGFLLSGVISLKSIKIPLSTSWMLVYSLPVTIIMSFIIIKLWQIEKRETDFIISNSGKQVIQSIEAYKKDTESYPDDLQALTPKYLKKMPRKKIPAFSQFKYTKKGERYTIQMKVMNDFFLSKVYVYNASEEDFPNGYLIKLSGHPGWEYYIDY